MNQGHGQDVYAHLSGQDDNLGDSALRAAYFQAARGTGRRFHLYFGPQTADYLSGMPLKGADRVYDDAEDWLASSRTASRPVLLLNSGELNPQPGEYPRLELETQLQQVIDRGGIAILAGAGLRDPRIVDQVSFHPGLRDAAVVSWRDDASRDAAGFGEVAPDWGFALGPSTSTWSPTASRQLLAVTLRYDRPWPGQAWLDAVRALAEQTSTRVVTLAQVARDAPRAVRLADALGGTYRTPPSMRHAELDRYARAIYQQSLAVVSDRAHSLILAATEGCYPIGSAADPQKLSRLFAVVGLADLVGHHDALPDLVGQLTTRLPDLAPAVDAARASIHRLTLRMQDAMNAVR